MTRLLAIPSAHAGCASTAIEIPKSVNVENLILSEVFVFMGNVLAVRKSAKQERAATSMVITKPS